MEGFEELERRIVSCEKCPRLVAYRKRVAEVKVRRFRDWDYWGKPVPGFGDTRAELLIIGLAPAAHGANRTGRMFTGDSSGEWLFRALYETGFSNMPRGVSRDDGLKLTNAYVTAVVRCAPPKNLPTKDEIRNCLPYLKAELSLLKRLKLVVTLGRIAFDTYTRLLGLRLKFGHNRLYEFGDSPSLLASYHPSRQNTQTGRLKWDEWLAVFRRARELLG